ncbi:MAG: transglutaminase domain-containing protein, partial [Clostridia bacterium]|nr:transglutaminase domain-containing protein [Clostridia bacterium]
NQDNFKAGIFVPDDYEAHLTLSDRIGTCSGYSSLMAALLREAGIPAKQVSGYTVKDEDSKWQSSMFDHPEAIVANHAWVEAFFDSKWHTYLYKVTGGEVTEEYYFKNPRYGSSIIGTTENYIYVEAKYHGRGIASYYSYDKRNGKTKKVSRPSGREIAGQPDNYIRVGKYEFFTDTVEYRIPDSNTMFGSRVGYCHYLYRRVNLKKEIMLYSLNSNDFYDDICNF